jgi:membrane-bound metal-dependent hydrolase YbcI (DUF457 family)
MTTPEHTLMGIHAAFALGWHRALGWSAVVMAGVASNVPDWDGLPMLFDMSRFEVGHRVWGHNIFAIFLSSLVLGWTQYRFHWIESVANWIEGKIPSLATELPVTPHSSKRIGLIALAGVAMFAQLLHLPCDMVVSGGNGLTDWEIRPFWPLSKAGYVFPMIPWGDVGPTVILMSGVICSAKWPAHLSKVSLITLLVLCVYLLGRAWMRGILFV